MARVSEFSVTAASPQTAFSSSSLGMSFCGLRSRWRRTRKAFGLTGNTSPAFISENSPLVDLDVRESENKALIRHHNSIATAWNAFRKESCGLTI